MAPIRAAAAPRRRRVAIVDSSPVIRDGLPLLLPEFVFVGSFPTCEALIRERPAADVLLLDLHLTHPGRTIARRGVEAIACAHQAGYRVCLYSSEYRDHLLLRCMRAGARGIVSKGAPVSVVAQVLSEVASGAIVTTQVLAGLTDLHERSDQVPTLTDRQAEVLSARARGEPFKTIARRLSISEKTAQEHWSVISTKFAAYLASHSAADLERALGLDVAEAFWHMDLAAS